MIIIKYISHESVNSANAVNSSSRLDRLRKMKWIFDIVKRCRDLFSWSRWRYDASLCQVDCALSCRQYVPCYTTRRDCQPHRRHPKQNLFWWPWPNDGICRNLVWTKGTFVSFLEIHAKINYFSSSPIRKTQNELL